MKSVLFLLPKHPYVYSGGDTRISRLMMDLVAQSASVRGVALCDQDVRATDLPYPIQLVKKPPVQALSLVRRSASTGRSLVHERFVVPELARYVGGSNDDRYVAEHAYMSEGYLDSRGDAAERLYVNLHVSEAEVYARSGPIKRWVAPFIRRDEIRCLQSAAKFAAFDEQDRLLYEHANPRNCRLDVSFPAQRLSRSAAGLGGGVLLFLGDRNWRPNQQAALEALRLWPSIRAAVPTAELLIVGRGPSLGRRAGQAGVRVAGFVPNLAALWDHVAALLAPVRTGGGVRVKILEAAAAGVPVVTTVEGAGDVPRYLPLRAAASDEDIVALSVDYLTNRRLARLEGEMLFEANAARWASGVLAEQVGRWLEL